MIYSNCWKENQLYPAKLSLKSKRNENWGSKLPSELYDVYDVHIYIYVMLKGVLQNEMKKNVRQQYRKG